MSRHCLTSGVATVPSASVKKLSDATGANVTFAKGVRQVLISNIGTNNVEIAYSAGSAPTTGNMDVLVPGAQMEFPYKKAACDLLYAKASGADTKVFIWQNGPTDGL